MTTPNGDVDFAADERLREEQQATDERLREEQQATDEQPAAEEQATDEQPAAEEQSAVEAADESPEEQDPAVALKADLATRPGAQLRRLMRCVA